MITSTITILCEGNNRLTYETKKPRNIEDLARRTNGPMDQPAYSDARTHIKRILGQSKRKYELQRVSDGEAADDDDDGDGDDEDRKN